MISRAEGRGHHLIWGTAQIYQDRVGSLSYTAARKSINAGKNRRETKFVSGPAATDRDETAQTYRPMVLAVRQGQQGPTVWRDRRQAARAASVSAAWTARPVSGRSA